jgi:hypothetical protein
MSAPGWLTTLFCPLLGAIISNAVGLAPVRAVLEARRKQNLGFCFSFYFSLFLLILFSYVTSTYLKLTKSLIEKSSSITMIRKLNNVFSYASLGALSPIPFALIVNCCLGWTMYGVFKGDYYIFFSNCFSLIVGIALCLTAIHILET